MDLRIGHPGLFGLSYIEIAWILGCFIFVYSELYKEFNLIGLFVVFFPCSILMFINISNYNELLLHEQIKELQEVI